MTVVRKCDRRFVSWWGGVMVMGRSIKGLEEVHHWTGSVSHQGGVKDINKNDVMRLGERPRSLEGKPNITGTDRD